MAKQGAATLVLTDGRKLLLDISHPLPADLVALEDTFNISADEMDGPNSRVKWSLFIMWRIARRMDADIMARSFEEFVDLVEDVIRDEMDDDAADPTEAAAPIE